MAVSFLVVEDDPERAARIVRVIEQSVSTESVEVTTVGTLYGARDALKNHYFELVVLDIALPEDEGSVVMEDAGIRLLEELSSRGEWYRVPGHVIGLTERPELLDRAGRILTARALSIVHYDRATNAWEDVIAARVRHSCLASASREASRDKVASVADVAVICALEDPELRAIRALPIDWEQFVNPGDYSTYWLGSVNSGDRTKRVVASCCPSMGIPSAAVHAAKMIASFSPTVVIVGGIACGVRDRVNLGDVVCASFVWDWGCGKWVGRDGEDLFLQAPRQLPSSRRLLRALEALQREGALSQVVREWPAERPNTEPKIHIGPVASGSAVLASRSQIDRIREQHRQLLAVEMEGYGVFVAADEGRAPQPETVLIKGIVDFGEEDKNDRWRPFGAFASAQIIGRLLRTL